MAVPSITVVIEHEDTIAITWSKQTTSASNITCKLQPYFIIAEAILCAYNAFTFTFIYTETAIKAPSVYSVSSESTPLT